MSQESDILALLEATVRKLHEERKTLHLMLTEVGIPEDIRGDGQRTCVMGRLAVLISRYKDA